MNGLEGYYKQIKNIFIHSRGGYFYMDIIDI